MELKYRAGTIQDLTRITQLVQAAIAHMNENGIPQWDELYPTEADFKEDIERGQLTVVLVENEITAVYVLNEECDEEYKNGRWRYEDVPCFIIHRLCVSPAFQNRGIASAVMAHIEEVVTKMGAGAIRLDAFSRNPYALRLYEKCGYETVGFADWRKGRFHLMEKRVEK